ncbi:MAG: LysM peptidoglycan-binding domain-containing protein [Firmicutes bacterium]|nr:LysM peptidoglycan-binding domain-containing protein [Bacillota bacterium]
MDAAVVPLAPAAGRPSMLFYVVQPGDSLWDIARRYTTTVEALVRANGLAEPEAVPAGMKLLIPKSPVAV